MIEKQTMPKATRKALEASIAHWRRLANGNRKGQETAKGKDCALCSLFWRIKCTGCPVLKKTGVDYCNSTPYYGAAEMAGEFGYDSKQFKSAAKKELAFLVSLRPKKGISK